MAFLHAKHRGLDSPGSSVFDLPTQQYVTRDQTPVGRDENRLPLDVQVHGTEEDEASYVIISGGTGGNAICAAFKNASYVLPVSDDGGSSSEIVRVLGGPSVGDIRSRLVRLIPPAQPASPLNPIRKLLEYRLPANCTDREARDQWREIVEGRSILWSGIPHDRKETLRGFLVHFESEILRRAHKNFDFRNGSIGNFFLAAAQDFFRSLPAAIFLFSSITNSQASILPTVVTNHTVTIAAELEDGGRLVGQCEISHPISQQPDSSDDSDVFSATDAMEGMGNPVVSRNVMFESTSKNTGSTLPSPITRVFYINAYGMEVHPSPNPDYIACLSKNEVLVYSCGSLWTSIIPCLAMGGVAAAIARSPTLRAKVLLLNSVNDRETEGYSATDYILAITKTLNSTYESHPFGLGGVNTTYPISAFITDLVYLKGTKVGVDIEGITRLGVRCSEVDGGTGDVPKFDAKGVRRGLQKVLEQR
ncbi:hypothetical protein M378DRAFT_183240 [Amanita muscaria Koide BX008]|uniref:Uncharacterized protein n=1 Tax=Amanita muscaria (strain Koide BX008) TaxID=946122 RepID=A0A0C2T415_AMAMK|nr:hypothetical protein M378DRAFT_183240 [Amanita muscaria Koide BX008]